MEITLDPVCIRRPRHVLGPLAAAILLGLTLVCGQARASLQSPMSAQVQAWVDEQLLRLSDANPTPLRLEVEIGQLDPRLRLAPCEKVEPFLPQGTVLWGRSRIGLRCVRGDVAWRVFLPVHVRAFGPAWLVQGSLPAGKVLAAADAVEGESEWTRQASPVIGDPAEWIGQVLVRAASPGAPITQSMLRPPRAFEAGARVRVVVSAPGFSISNQGVSLAAASVGQSVRVRLDSGRIVSGLVVDDSTVELKL